MLSWNHDNSILFSSFLCKNTNSHSIGHLRVSRKALFADPYRKTSSVGDGNITSVEKAIMDHVKNSQTEIDNKEKTNQEKSVKNWGTKSKTILYLLFAQIQNLYKQEFIANQ